jgi:hypothetical protein
MKTTHWHVQDNPELWHDDPSSTPAGAAESYLEGEADEAWDVWHDLKHGPCTITVYGWHETSKPLDPEVAFDGYEPGQTYFCPTKETKRITISIKYTEEA